MILRFIIRLFVILMRVFEVTLSTQCQLPVFVYIIWKLLVRSWFSYLSFYCSWFSYVLSFMSHSHLEYIWRRRGRIEKYENNWNEIVEKTEPVLMICASWLELDAWCMMCEVWCVNSDSFSFTSHYLGIIILLLGVKCSLNKLK